MRREVRLYRVRDISLTRTLGERAVRRGHPSGAEQRCFRSRCGDPPCKTPPEGQRPCSASALRTAASATASAPPRCWAAAPRPIPMSRATAAPNRACSRPEPERRGRPAGVTPCCNFPCAPAPGPSGGRGLFPPAAPAFFRPKSPLVPRFFVDTAPASSIILGCIVKTLPHTGANAPGFRGPIINHKESFVMAKEVVSYPAGPESPGG